MSLDPRHARTLDATTMLALLPGVANADLRPIREQFARYLTTPVARRHESWQEAWNAFTGATPSRDGVVSYTPTRCPSCRGRRFSARNPGRNLARTGSPYICAECRGRPTPPPARQRARAAVVPRSSDAPAD